MTDSVAPFKTKIVGYEIRHYRWQGLFLVTDRTNNTNSSHLCEALIVDIYIS